MMKENQRTALTKQRLQHALLRMLKTHAIHQISIRELCLEAEINRTTFYNHYGSQYELLRDISQRYLDAIADCLHAADATNRESIQRRVVLVLRYIAENIELSALLFNNNVDPDFAERLFSLPQITDLLDAALAGCTDPGEKQATIAFAIHGSCKLLRDWINTPHPISPEAQTALILRLARRVCRE